MYPDPSDWTSSATDSAWVFDLGTGRRSVCQTNGWGFLYTIGGDLTARLATPLPTFDGTTVGASAVPDVSAGWTADLLRALYAVAQQDGAPSNYLQAISSDAATQTVSSNTLAVAVWIERGRSDSGGTTGSPADIQIPDGSTLPQWGPAPRPAQSSFGFDCMPIPANSPVQPASTSVVPFQMDAILVLTVIGIVVFGAALVANKIPVRRIINPRRRRRTRR